MCVDMVHAVTVAKLKLAFDIKWTPRKQDWFRETNKHLLKGKLLLHGFGIYAKSGSYAKTIHPAVSYHRDKIVVTALSKQNKQEYSLKSVIHSFIL